MSCPRCRADSLTIYDGASDRAPLLERTCGKYLPGEVLTSGRHAFLQLITDTGVEGRGFSIAWTAVSTRETQCCYRYFHGCEVSSV